jgi:hypothetical protein
MLWAQSGGCADEGRPVMEMPDAEIVEFRIA